MCPRLRRNLSSSLHRVQYLFVPGSRCLDEHETLRQESCYVDGERFHEGTPLPMRSSKAVTSAERLEMRARHAAPHSRVRTHFVTHSCIFRFEQFATRASLSHTTSYARASQFESFVDAGNTHGQWASREVGPIPFDGLR